MKIEIYQNGKWNKISKKEFDNLPKGTNADDISIDDYGFLGWDEIHLFLHKYHTTKRVEGFYEIGNLGELSDYV